MKKIFLILLLLLVIHLILLVNLQFTAWPEMFSYPYLRNNGFFLYKDMIHPYPPVLTMALSVVYKFFGYKLIVLKMFTWLIILVSDVLIFLIVRKITNKNIFAFSSLVFYILTQPFLEGNQLWFDLAIVPSILFGILFLLNKKYFLSGLFLGVAILTKQTTGIFLIFWSLFILVGERKLKPVINLCFGPIILFLILLARLVTEGAVSGFFNWTLIYPFTFWSKFPGYVQMALSNREMVVLILLFVPLFFSIAKLKKQSLLILSVFASLLLIYPRFSFFHFQITLALISILFGYLTNKFSVIYLILITLLIIQPVIGNWGKKTRFYSNQDIDFAKIIQNNSSINDKIFLLGLPSSIYVLSDRIPPKPWTDNFGWYLEIPNVQKDIISRWKDSYPEEFFWQDPGLGNWFDIGSYQPKEIADWIKTNYIKEKEVQSGVWLWRHKTI